MLVMRTILLRRPFRFVSARERQGRVRHGLEQRAEFALQFGRRLPLMLLDKVRQRRLRLQRLSVCPTVRSFTSAKKKVVFT